MRIAIGQNIGVRSPIAKGAGAKFKTIFTLILFSASACTAWRRRASTQSGVGRSGQKGCVLEISLHIGAHRSATTTMQQFLDRNRPTLRQSGVEIWTPERTRNGLFSGLVERPEDITEQIERRGLRSSGLIAIELELLARAGRRQVLISDENMIGSTRNNLRQVRLYPLADERLMRFRPAFGHRLRRIGLSIRSYDTFWASSLAFGIGQGFRMPRTGDLDHYITQPRRWRDLIRDVAAVFPGVDIVVWPFERFAGQPETQLAILTDGLRLGVPLTGARDWINPSPRSDKLRMILSMRGETDLGYRLTERDGRWMPFDDAQRMALRAQYSVDLDWLRRGADGLARLVDSGAPVASDRPDHLTATGSQDVDRDDRTRKGQIMPDVLAEGGRDFVTQEVMV